MEGEEKKTEEDGPEVQSKSIKYVLRKVKILAPNGSSASTVTKQLAKLEGIEVHDVFRGPQGEDGRPVFTLVLRSNWSLQEKNFNFSKLKFKELEMYDSVEKCTIFVHRVPHVVATMDEKEFQASCEEFFEYEVRSFGRFTSNGKTKVVIVTEDIDDCKSILSEKSINLCGFTVPRRRYSRKRLSSTVPQCYNCFGLRHRAYECKRGAICHKCGCAKHATSDSDNPDCAKKIPYCVLCEIHGHSAIQYSCPVKKCPQPTQAEKLKKMGKATPSQLPTVAKTTREKPRLQDAPIPCENAWQKRKQSLAPPPVACAQPPMQEVTSTKSTKEDLEVLCVKLAAAAVHLAREQSVPYGMMYNELLAANGETPVYFPVTRPSGVAKRAAEMAFTPALEETEKRFCFNSLTSRACSLLSIPEKCREEKNEELSSSNASDGEEICKTPKLLRFPKGEENNQKSGGQKISADQSENLLTFEQIEEKKTVNEVPEFADNPRSKKARNRKNKKQRADVEKPREDKREEEILEMIKDIEAGNITPRRYRSGITPVQRLEITKKWRRKYAEKSIDNYYERVAWTENGEVGPMPMPVVMGDFEHEKLCSNDMKRPTPDQRLDLDVMIKKLLFLRKHPGKIIKLEEAQIRALLLVAREVLMGEPCLVEVSAPVNILGDIHGQFNDLLRHFDKLGHPPHQKYILLGDYVDRGKQSIETICLALAYKVKFPNDFHVLRGNHECASINRIYGFYDECKRRYNVKLWKCFTDVFNCMPLAALVEDSILCMHGGISPELRSLDQIRQVQRPLAVPAKGIVCDLLWADPDSNVDGYGPNNRGVSYVFGKDAVDDFLKKFDLDLIVRAHQVVEDGYEFFADQSLVTIFSAPNYCGEFHNTGAVLQIKKDLTCSFSLLPPDTATTAIKSGKG